MLTGKYVSMKHAVERVFSDYGDTFAAHFQLDSAVEWVWEVLALTGVPQVYTDVLEEVSISDYKGQLPADLFQLLGVRDADTKRPLVCLSNPFDKIDLLTGNSSSGFNLPLLVSTTALDTDDNVVSRTSNVIWGYTGEIDSSSTTLATYKLDNDYIFTSLEEMELEIAYKAFLTDEEGLPMIPDNVKYINAVRDRIAERIAWKIYLNDELTESKYEKIKQEWLWYVAASRTAGRIPSIDKMEAIKNRFLRLKQNVNEHKTSFNYFAEPGKIRKINNVG